MNIPAYLNGYFEELSSLKVSVLDRGFLFGDAVYEVVLFRQGKYCFWPAHLERLIRNCDAIGIHSFTDQSWTPILDGLRARLPENSSSAKLYIQVTRGVESKRSHLPKKHNAPTLLAYLEPMLEIQGLPPAIKAATVLDLRSRLSNIKSTNLLVNILALRQAEGAGASEALLVDEEGNVHEGARQSVAILRNSELLFTTPGDQCLPGVTMLKLMDAAASTEKIKVRMGHIHKQDLFAAEGVIFSSTTQAIQPVMSLDGEALKDCQTHPDLLRLLKAYNELIDSE